MVPLLPTIFLHFWYSLVSLSVFATAFPEHGSSLAAEFLELSRVHKFPKLKELKVSLTRLDEIGKDPSSRSKTRGFTRIYYIYLRSVRSRLRENESFSDSSSSEVPRVRSYANRHGSTGVRQCTFHSNCQGFRLSRRSGFRSNDSGIPKYEEKNERGCFPLSQSMSLFLSRFYVTRRTELSSNQLSSFVSISRCFSPVLYSL